MKNPFLSAALVQSVNDIATARANPSLQVANAMSQGKAYAKAKRKAANKDKIRDLQNSQFKKR